MCALRLLSNIINNKLNYQNLLIMEINVLKNKIFDEFHDDVKLVLNPNVKGDAVTNSAVFICHFVGTSVRYDKMCDSIDSAITESRALLHTYPDLVYYVIYQSIKTYNYAKLKVIR